VFTANHDQVANTVRGQRPQHVTSPGKHRAMTALLLLNPATPMLFQGQEFDASSPFLYFADQRPDLAAQVRVGRCDFMRQFPSVAAPPISGQLPDPADEQTFLRSKLDNNERVTRAEALELHADLIRLRREDAVIGAQRFRGVDGAVIGPEAFALRYFGDAGDDRLLIVNFGCDLCLAPAPEPLLAPPLGARWAVAWSSEDPRYGGTGAAPADPDDDWRVSGESALLLTPAPLEHTEDDD
jgi:maltooligosyltrehalose trehalohydrolase